jgi:hypothetical protein
MNKIILTILLTSAMWSCSKDDNCQENKDAINLKYDTQIQYVKDHPGPTGIDYRQIGLLDAERSKKLAEACS